MFHRTLLDMLDKSHHIVPRHRRRHRTHENSLRHFTNGMQFGHLAKSSLHRGYEPKSCIDVSSGHTPINYTSRRNSFDVEHDLTTTVAASENSDGFHQEAAASGSQR